jgi:polysaccharide export outer membrane protein
MRKVVIVTLTAAFALAAGPLHAQSAAGSPASASSSAAAGVALPSDYTIGPEDVLGILFWRDTEMSGDVTVRPDGMITLPLLGDLRAVGLTPASLATQVESAAGKLITEPNVNIVVRQINSRKVYITGEVSTPGSYPLTGPRTVMQLIALAGGVSEYADSKNITVMRTDEQGRQQVFRFNYKDVAKGKNLQQNILLKSGDTVVVP